MRGPFIKPHVGVQAGPLIVRAAAAVAALAAAPGALVLVPITVPGAEDNANCAPLMAKAAQPPKAGVPTLSAPASEAAPSGRKPPTQMPAAGEFSGGQPQRR